MPFPRAGWLARSDSAPQEDLGGPVDEGLAAGFPDQDVVIAVAERRLLVVLLRRVKGVPKDLPVEYPLQDVVVITVTARWLMTRLAIMFADGSSVDLDAQKPARPQTSSADSGRSGHSLAVARPNVLRGNGGRTSRRFPSGALVEVREQVGPGHR